MSADLERDLSVLKAGGRVHIGVRRDNGYVITGRRQALTRHLPNSTWRIIREAEHVWLQLKGPLTNDEEDAGHGGRAAGDVGDEHETLLGVLGPPADSEPPTR